MSAPVPVIPVTEADPAALYDALNLASLAVLAAESGDQDRAVMTRFEAGLAAALAFPADSPEAGALGVILAAVAMVPEAIA